MKKIKFLNLGRHPITNNFLSKENPKNEFFYNLNLIYHPKTKLISLDNFVSPKKMFNNKYAHRASASITMCKAYEILAKKIKKRFYPKSILEIGSNDGVFIKHFSKIKNIGVEPCKNLANITTRMKIKTYDKFWTMNLSKKISSKHGKFDVIYSANTISHIHNLEETFKAIENSLTLRGVFILEDPSLLKSLQKTSYDQFYDEHAYVFSITALKNITRETGLEIFNIEELKTHGGSNRVYFKKVDNKEIKISKTVNSHLSNERKFGINKLKTYQQFARKVKYSKKNLIKIFQTLKKKKNKIIGYGATYKSSTILNFCQINKNYISYFLDTTPTKAGKFTPGTHIPIRKYSGISDDVDYAFLGAWNFKDEIFKKEKKFRKRGGKFITHVPYPRII
ncbi:class I SAM-dependent methyltransferase [Candidatus Pelagibacter sp.]|nr:class I SAM-dependent methyltransferase [Candidatus Pelagibacter sp.]